MRHALAAGCTMVLKPGPRPFSRWRCANWLSGRVRRRFSCVTGGAQRDRRRDDLEPDRRKLTFTGSTEIAIAHGQCAATVNEDLDGAGRQAPFIEFDDADIEMAVKGAIASKYRNRANLRCANRIWCRTGSTRRSRSASPRSPVR